MALNTFRMAAEKLQYSPFTLSKPHSSLRIDGERGFLTMNGLYINTFGMTAGKPQYSPFTLSKPRSSSRIDGDSESEVFAQ